MVEDPNLSQLDSDIAAKKQTEIVRNAIELLIDGCKAEKKDSNESTSKLDQAIKEIDLKSNSFNNVLTILRDLENDDSNVIEQMFMYKLNEKEELDKEALKVTREYHNGSLDPNNKNHKYE